MKPEYKRYLIIGGLVILLLITGYFIFFRNRSNSQQSTDIEPTEEVIPTVDSSVKVSLTGASGNREVILTVKGVPSGTELVDYELSYQTATQGLQGVIGTVMTEGKSTFEKKLTLGTCSSGTCVYHEVVGKIKLTLKFGGDYGEKLFEKEYEL